MAGKQVLTSTNGAQYDHPARGTPSLGAVVALALLVSLLGGLGASLTVGVLGLFAGALIADKSIWLALPFSWPMRAILPLAAIHPNGVPLDFGDPLRDPGVLIPAIGLSVAFAALVLAIGGALTKRKEI